MAIPPIVVAWMVYHGQKHTTQDPDVKIDRSHRATQFDVKEDEAAHWKTEITKDSRWDRPGMDVGRATAMQAWNPPPKQPGLAAIYGPNPPKDAIMPRA